VGVGVGALTWLAIDLYGASQLLSYLRSGGANDHGKLFGIWGESAGRMHRLIRDRDSQVAESQRRLQDFLSALQASPSGVILLDKTARIEWCNHTATQHFGLNAQRDVLQVIGNLVRDPGFAAYLASRDYKSSVNMPGRDSSPARPVVLSVQLHPYGEGRMLLLSRDITDAGAG
jgi:two-component system phosphate regulon sensor histidine kinase PhoR